MITIDIREIKVTSPLDYAMRKLEENLQVVNPKRNETRYFEYLSLVKALDLLEQQGKVKITFLDDPKNPLKSHTVDFDLIQDAWEGKEKETFLGILNNFSGFMFTGDVEGNISVMCLFEGIYTENKK